MADALVEKVKQRYEEKEALFGAPMMRWLERRIILDIVDTQWKDHLLTLDHLKEGIGLRGYGQKDPLVEFKKEAFTLFEDMMGRIDSETTRYLFLIQPAKPEDEAREIERRQQPPAATAAISSRARPSRSSQARPRRRQSRPQRSLPLRQRQKIQEVLRQGRLTQPPILQPDRPATRSLSTSALAANPVASKLLTRRKTPSTFQMDSPSTLN